MSRIIMLLVPVVLVGCVAAYDASDLTPTVAATRAESVGAAQPRIRAARWQPPPEPKAQPQAEPVAEAPAPEAAPTPAVAPANTAVALPDSALGRELAWLLTVFNGADLSGPRGQAALESHFAAEFLKSVPAAQIRSITTQLRRDQFDNKPATLTKLTIADNNATRGTAMIRGDATGKYIQLRVAVDQDGKIAGLLAAPMEAVAAEGLPNFAALTDRLVELSGPDGVPASGKSLSISFGAYALTDEGSARGTLTPIATLGETRPLALGSTFKLWILAALGQDIAAKSGSLTWDTKLSIKDSIKSLPSGKMQLLEEGTEFTVSHFAKEMISISDNTATDHLLFAVGRERVEKTMAELTAKPDLNIPFLSTLEMFKLKLGQDRDLAKRWSESRDVAAKRTKLDKGGAVESQTPSLVGAMSWNKPYYIDTVEWFASPRDLATLMAELRRLEKLPGNAPLGAALRTNPGLGFDPAKWKSVGYKGGSEPGVMNMTWLLERQDGRWFVLTITFNDTKAPVAEQTLIGYATAAADLLGRWLPN